MKARKSGPPLPPAALKTESEPVMAYASDNRAVGLNLSARIEFAVANWKAAQEKRKIYNRTVRELNELSDSELADIGLSRSMIRSVARDAANMS